MVVGVWELVKFLWNHPILSCLVLLLFSPPFFPIIVYFSPLLVCTGLVVIAMVSMNVGQRGGNEDWRNDARRAEPPVHVEMLVKRDSWFEWMKKKEEKVKAWVYSRFLNQGNWHFWAPAPNAVDYNDSNEDYSISNYRELSHPTLLLNGKTLRPLQIKRDFSPPLAAVAKDSTTMSYFSVPASEDIKPIPRVQDPKEGPKFESSSLEKSSPVTLVVQLPVAGKEFLKESVVLPSQQEEVLPVLKDQAVVEKEIPTAPKTDSLVAELPVGDYESEQRSLNEKATEVPRVSRPLEEVLLHVDGTESIRKAPDEAEILTRFEADHGDEWTKTIQTSSDLDGSRQRTEDVLVVPELSSSVENRNASPEAEPEMRGIPPSNQPEVIRSDRFIATEKIIFVDDPGESTAVQGRSMETGILETNSIHKPIAQIVGVETDLHGSSLLKDRSLKDGLDENIESCGKVPPTIRSNSEPVALVSRSVLEASSLSETNALVLKSLHYPDELELLAAYMEPVMSVDNDAALAAAVTVLDRSCSLNSTLAGGGGGEDDDLTARFHALKKSMSFHTTGSEEPISLAIAEVNNAVAPVYIPDVDTTVDTNSLSESLVFPEKSKPKPRLSGGNVESVEAITARLQKKFTPNLGDGAIVRPPPTRPVPALPAAARRQVDSTAPVESDKSAELTDSPVPPVDVPAVENKLPANAENSQPKTSLTSFLIRRREKLMSSKFGEGERAKRMSSEAIDVAVSAEVSGEDRDEGSPSTSGRLLRDRMISPLKRVFSMDGNAGSSRKGDTLKVSSGISSPAREKHSVIDRSKSRVMKLFSSEGGPTKLELPEARKVAVLDTISLRKSKSVSRASEGTSEFLEGLNALVRDGLSLPTTPKSAPSSDGNGIESVDAESGKQMFRGSETADHAETAGGRKLPETMEKVNVEMAEPVGVENITLEPLNLDLGAPDDGTKLGEDKATKGSSEKKFLWSWTKSEKKEMPGNAAATLSQTSEQLDSELEPPLQCSSEGMPPTTLDKGTKLDDSASVRGDTMAKLSSEKKLLWSWTKSEKQLSHRRAGSLTEIPEELDGKWEQESENPTSQDIEATSAAGKAESESKLEPVGSSLTNEKVSPTTLASGGPDDSVEFRGHRATKSPSEKKFAWSWTKKKRSAEPQDAHGDRLRSLDDIESLPEKGVDEEVKHILMSPLPGFHSCSPMSPVDENADISVPEHEEHSPELVSVQPDSNPNLQDSRKTDSPSKKTGSSWWTPKSHHSPMEKSVQAKEKKTSTSWWSKRNSRADSKAVPSSSDLTPIDNNVVNDGNAVSHESLSTPDNKSDERFFERNSNRLLNEIILNDGDDLAAVPHRPRHRRERSDSLPASIGKFSRLRWRQASMSEISLPRTPELELSPASSSGRTTTSIGNSTSLSVPSDEGHLHEEDVKAKKNNGHELNGRNNIVWRSNSSPLTSYQKLDFANEQLRGSPFHRSDSSTYRNSPSGAEIRITDKLKVPLEEVLSLLSTGDSAEHNSMTVDNSTGGAVAGEHEKAVSSSSSEEETEEEWSATSEDEAESQHQQQKEEQVRSLPPTGRIRRKLPHYIFSRVETPAT